MSDTPPIEEPLPPTGTAADAVDAGQARDTVEAAARAVFVAALLWYAVHGDKEPSDQSLLRKSARRLAGALWWARPRLSSTKPRRSATAERDTWVAEQTDQIVKGAVGDAGAHYDTVFKRMRHADPHVSEPAVRAEYKMDHAWSTAAARSTATRLAAETAMGMQPDVEAFTGEPHHVMWISRGDPKVRALHRRLHGTVRPPGTPFHTWPDGAELRYPGDPTAPIDAWINCRCTLLLVPAKDAKDAEAVFHVPDADFDVPIASSAARGGDTVRAEGELHAEKLRRYTTNV